MDPSSKNNLCTTVQATEGIGRDWILRRKGQIRNMQLTAIGLCV